MTRNELTSSRLRIVIPSSAMAGEYARYMFANRQHHADAGPAREERMFTEAYWHDQLPNKRARAEEGSSFEFVIVEAETRDRIVGQIALNNIIRGVFQAAYLGYNLDIGAVGKGYMTEALKAVIDFAFLEQKLHRLMANYVPTNARSGRVLRRCGFTVEGYARDYLFLNGKWQDHILTALYAPRETLD